jgi:hypothetical protein
VEKAREGLLAFIRRINDLDQQPGWYNALTTNCTTSIWHHLRQIQPQSAGDWRVLANGYLDEMAYEAGAINQELPFHELRARSDITERARAAGNATDFARRIRDGLPRRPPPRRGTTTTGERRHAD